MLLGLILAMEERDTEEALQCVKRAEVVFRKLICWRRDSGSARRSRRGDIGDPPYIASGQHAARGLAQNWLKILGCQGQPAQADLGD